MYGLMSSAVNDCVANGGGVVGNGCVGHACSPGTSLAGTGRSSIGQIGSPVTRSNTYRNPVLLACATTSTSSAVVADGRQLRRGRVVVVPQVVMHHLEMPQPLAGARVEREQRSAEQVRAEPIGAVVVVGRRPGREVGDAARRVDRDLAPGVGAADVLPRVLRPRVVAELARVRDGVELPDELAGDDVEGAQVAGRRQVVLARWPSRG